MKVYEVLQVIDSSASHYEPIGLYATFEAAKASLGAVGWLPSWGVDLAWKKIGRATFTVHERVVQGG